MAEQAHDAAVSSTDYIKHHLTNMTYGRGEDGSWHVAETAAEAKAMGFNAIHLDSMAWSIGLGLIFCLMFWGAARRAHARADGDCAGCARAAGCCGTAVRLAPAAAGLVRARPAGGRTDRAP